jgi:RimJ/RimL family protein N-acetyltransferase
MTLRGRRCFVRPWRLADADALVRHANNLNVAKQLRDRFPHPYSRASATAFLKFAAQDDDPTNLAIEVRGEAAGGIGFVPGSDVERYSAEIGYWLGEAHWGRGIVTEALMLVTDDVFRRRNMLRLFALPFADNVGSARVLEKAGYVCEGILRASAVKFGRPRDQAIYARINPDWRLG